ncbi:hypothetical protein AB6O49_32460 [Streptomyces sp. SBR177]
MLPHRLPVPVRRVAATGKERPAAGQLGGRLGIEAEPGPDRELLGRRAGLGLPARRAGGLHEAGHDEHPQGEVPAARPRADQGSEPCRGLRGEPARQFGPGDRPLGERRRLDETVRPGRAEGPVRVLDHGRRVAPDGGGQGEHRVLVGGRVALPRRLRRTESLPGVRGGALVPARPQLGVGQVLEHPGQQRAPPVARIVARARAWTRTAAGASPRTSAAAPARSSRRGSSEAPSRATTRASGARASSRRTASAARMPSRKSRSPASAPAPESAPAPGSSAPPRATAQDSGSPAAQAASMARNRASAASSGAASRSSPAARSSA